MEVAGYPELVQVQGLIRLSADGRQQWKLLIGTMDMSGWQGKCPRVPSMQCIPHPTSFFQPLK